MSNKTAIIIGAGPAGLTTAFELLSRTDIKPIIYELSGEMGGIAKTVKYKGNRIDIGGHRFFSKSDRVMDWWNMFMPLQATEGSFDISYQNKTRAIGGRKDGLDPDKIDLVMLVRNRLSRIFFLRKFFDYPIKLSIQTLRNLGLWRLIKIFFTYLWVRLFPIRHEKSLEDFFINRFGKELYLTFFKDYTEKVWGISCKELKPEWGSQRIKGLSISTAILHAARSLVKRKDESVGQKDVETSLIERFLYPKFGPGQMWEEVARVVVDRGGIIHTEHQIIGLTLSGQSIESVSVKNIKTGEVKEVSGDYVFSTMPIKELIVGMRGNVPEEVREVSQGLQYRDFITVGLLLNKLIVKDVNKKAGSSKLIPDNWIYIQERDVKIGRLQIFNNWSPYMVADKSKVWLGLEYFCYEGDDLWNLSDKEMSKLGSMELAKIGFIDEADVVDSVVLRVKKTYPAYSGTYEEFDKIKNFTKTISNLFLIGRNGMHRYNNQDHSMLTAMVSVDNIVAGIVDKTNIWEVNTEQEYHEEKNN